ncbi:type II secretion system protein [Sphingomonas oleivorans]|uniref:Type II secretion system protein n=1 Tax=Sphingomonas oleivorans TaxID=1735121 RepID=A0A2T5FY13_9SPHN|nr:GspE/PulE family protein [Sphingomonas oleivorans]PTQ11427.1 type II secretion system protein [Sphingomonas oleivorans]
MRRIAEMLLARGLVTERDLDDAAALQRHTGSTLPSALVRLGALAEENLLLILSEELGMPLLGRAELPASAAVAEAIERLHIPLGWLAEKQAVLWFEGMGAEERLCLAGPRAYDAELQEAAEQGHDAPARLHLVASEAIAPLLAALGEEAQTEAAAASISTPSRLRELAEEAPVIDFVNAMFAEAVARRASDIHVEPFEDVMTVRLRVDGLLVPWRSAPRTSFDAVASRIKLLSEMDIAERRLPQDGRQSIRMAGQDIDARVSSLPTVWGESIVLRFLGKTRDLPTLTGLGLSDEDAARLLATIAKPNGIVIVSGPTGSGKTTTVYRLISHLNDGVRKIVTIEDPVEIDFPGVLQMNVRADIGLSFAAGLRSILRQDPDVIFIGEIRDSETARIAVQAALTGHLVISTVHTDSAVAAITRLLDLGLEDFLLADVLTGLVAQRLLRRLCTECGGTGCAQCGDSGYRGRIGAFEVVTLDAPLRAAIRSRASQDELLAIARASGLRTMQEDAALKTRRGETSLGELRRVLGG